MIDRPEAILDLAPRDQPRGHHEQRQHVLAMTMRQCAPHRRRHQPADDHDLQQRGRERMNGEGAGEQGLGGDHLRGGPAEHRGAQPENGGKPLYPAQNQRRAPYDDGNGDREPQDHEQPRAVRSAADSEHVVHAHHRVRHDDGPDRAAKRCARLDRVLLALVVRELPADVDERRTAHEQEAGNVEQPHDDPGQQRAHDDGAGRAPRDHLALQRRCDVARGEADDDGVVPREHEIDQHDRREGREPCGGADLQHHNIAPRMVRTCTPCSSTSR